MPTLGMDSVLSDALKRDEATLLTKEAGYVHFKCKCGAAHRKQHGAIVKTTGAFCRDCTSRNTSIKRIQAKIARMNLLMMSNDSHVIRP
jgi:hypothetical protein